MNEEQVEKVKKELGINAGGFEDSTESRGRRRSATPLDSYYRWRLGELIKHIQHLHAKKHQHSHNAGPVT